MVFLAPESEESPRFVLCLEMVQRNFVVLLDLRSEASLILMELIALEFEIEYRSESCVRAY